MAWIITGIRRKRSIFFSRRYSAAHDIAREKKLPFMIHSRDAAEDTLNIVKEYMKDGTYGGVIHCFSYSKEIAREYLNMGLYLESAEWLLLRIPGS